MKEHPLTLEEAEVKRYGQRALMDSGRTHKHGMCARELIKDLTRFTFSYILMVVALGYGYALGMEAAVEISAPWQSMAIGAMLGTALAIIHGD